MNIKSIGTVVLFAATLIWNGCTTPGCTDPNAENYESVADSDDGSCEYSGDVVFWYGEAVSEEMELHLYKLAFVLRGRSDRRIYRCKSILEWSPKLRRQCLHHRFQKLGRSNEFSL